MLEINKIHQGDCLELMKGIKDISVDMILCDLPYGTTACIWDAIIPFKELWKEYYRVIRPNGFIILTASQPFTTKLINSNIDNFSHQWIWEKEQGANPLLANVQPMKNFEDVIVFSNEYKNYDYDFNHPLRKYTEKLFNKLREKKKNIFKTMNNQSVCHFMRFGSTQFNICTKECYDDLISLYKINEYDFYKPYEELIKEDIDFKKTLNIPPRIYNPQKVNGKKYTSGKGYLEHLGFQKQGGIVSSERYPTSIIKFNTDKTKSKHPTQKPVALFEYLIKTYSNKGDLILDNCIGSGTTAIACKKNNRNFIGIEKEQKYCDIANKRLQEVQLPLNVNTQEDGIPPTTKVVGILPNEL